MRTYAAILATRGAVKMAVGCTRTPAFGLRALILQWIIRLTRDNPVRSSEQDGKTRGRPTAEDQKAEEGEAAAKV